MLSKEFLAKHHFEEQTTGNEEKFEQLHVTRSIMHSPLYPKTRLMKKQDDIMIEKEKSLLKAIEHHHLNNSFQSSLLLYS